MNTILMFIRTFLIVLGTIFFLLIVIVTIAIAILSQLTQNLQQKINQKIQNGDINRINKGNEMNLISSDLISFFSDIFSDFPLVGNFLKKHLDSYKDGIDYLNNSIPKIINDWNSRELVVRATPQFLDSVEIGEPEKSFKFFWDNLGQLKVYKGIKKIEGDNYFAEAIFEKGIAELQLQLTQDDNKYFINNFQVTYLP